jgi:hypothetical protein
MGSCFLQRARHAVAGGMAFHVDEEAEPGGLPGIGRDSMRVRFTPCREKAWSTSSSAPARSARVRMTEVLQGTSSGTAGASRASST